MKRGRSIVLGGLLASSLLIANPTSAEDISGHWAYNSMSYLIEQNIMQGDEHGRYLPNAVVTRAQFATFLARALDLPKVEDSMTYKDVKPGNWFYDEVNSVSHYGIVLGDENGNFNPNHPINRQEMAVMTKRAMDYIGYEYNPVSLYFKDTAKIPDWAFNSVRDVVSMKIIMGKPGNLFAPSDTATRAEAANVIYRLLNPDLIEETIPVGETQYITTSYERQFDNVATIQANNKPKVDGGGVFIASKPLVAYYLNPSNFKDGTPEFYQFLKLSKPVTNLDERVLNQKILSDKGTLAGSGGFFLQAGAMYDVNAIYLISHALHETGNGKSALAQGIEVGLNEEGKPEMVTEENRDLLTDIKKTYNTYGIGAIDKDPNKFGSERAYAEGWFTVRDAVIGGTKFVRERYIDVGQDTLYKMRWNPENPSVHQYATHVQWAVIQARKIEQFYKLTGADKTTQLSFEIPRYHSQPSTSVLPAPEYQYAVDYTLSGSEAKTTELVRIRTYPSTSVSTNVVGQLPEETLLTVHGHNGPWYQVTAATGEFGWVHGEYITFDLEPEVPEEPGEPEVPEEPGEPGESGDPGELGDPGEPGMEEPGDEENGDSTN